MAKKLVPRSQLQGMTKKERQRFVREVRRAEMLRLAQQRRQRRILGWSVAGLAVVAVGSIVTIGTVNAVASASTPTATPAVVVGPANMLSDGLLFTGDGTTATATRTAALTDGEDPVATVSDAATTGILDVQVYLDPTNADAATLWSTIGASLEAEVAAGSISLELHPVVAQSGDVNAISAVAAFSCVADTAPDEGLAAWDALLTQTATAGLTSLEVATTVQGALSDATVDAVTSCMSAGTFTTWADDASTRAATTVAAAGADLTQGVVVTAAGSVYTGAVDDATAFQTFLSDAYTAAVGE
ncbi:MULTISPECIES: hypothetical protein [unclassified Microbacterium]|uniref:hypothetical protein n=1 Tax=unclassified Microbacterium TaxID=2609290 RepID=UPI001ACB9C36|nr:MULTISPECIES: hypothetical protein [unclassified Microbacterium]MBN9216195.1 hypothetical protein [Microbacterium sp.]